MRVDITVGDNEKKCGADGNCHVLDGAHRSDRIIRRRDRPCRLPTALAPQPARSR